MGVEQIARRNAPCTCGSSWKRDQEGGGGAGGGVVDTRDTALASYGAKRSTASLSSFLAGGASNRSARRSTMRRNYADEHNASMIHADGQLAAPSFACRRPDTCEL